MNLHLWLILFTLIGAGFYSGSETALISVGKIKLQHWIEKQHRGAWLARKFLDRPGAIIATLLVGTNLMNIATTVLISDLVFRLFPTEEASLSLLATAVIIPAVVTPPVLLFGEIIPKTIGREYAGWLIPLVSEPLIVSYWLFTPVVKISYGFSELFLGAFGIKKPAREELFTRQNVKRALVESEREGFLDAEERDYISGVFNFGETTVREAMTPRTEIVAVKKDAGIKEIAAKMFESNYSRIPIFEESLDHIVGIVHVMDLLGTESATDLKIHPVIFTPETKKCDSLLYEMRLKKCHLAVVIDEFGGTAGIVTFEDLLEQLVGDIQDVHDKKRSLVTVRRDRSMIVDGRTPLEDFEGKITLPATEYEVETIGGLLTSVLGRIPESGEEFQIGKVKITVLEASANRVERLELRQGPPPDQHHPSPETQDGPENHGG